MADQCYTWVSLHIFGIIYSGTVGFPIWQIDIDPMLAGGPYTVHVTSMDCVISLHEILFGDVWLCSGQSNMDHMLKDVIFLIIL